MNIQTDVFLGKDRSELICLINSLSGAKSANLVGTQDEEGNQNLAIFSSAVH